MNMFRSLLDFDHLLTPLAVEKVTHITKHGSRITYAYVYIFGLRIAAFNIVNAN